jgi:hypothetical protein
MNNRIPGFILGALVLLAIIWRVVNPPPPPLPGPYGMPPTWDSHTKVGTMAASAVNPSGTMWAGAWNEKTKDGKLRSALIVVDLEKSKAYRRDLGFGVFTSGLGWADDNTVRALLVDSEDPTQASTSKIAYLRDPGSASPKFETGEPLKKTAARVLSWPAGSDLLVAQLTGSTDEVVVGVLDKAGAVVGATSAVMGSPVPQVHHVAGLAPDGGSFVYSTSADRIGGDVVYHYVRDAKNAARPGDFTSKDLPGRVEGMWVSPAGALILLSHRDRFETLRYDPTTSEVGPVGGADIAKSWPDAPKSMMFVAYNGGYDFDLASGKAKQLFDLTRQGKSSDMWRRQVQDGRLYPRKDGNYTAISLLADSVDIRVIEKDGDRGANILPRG